MEEKVVATNRPRYRAGNKETAVKAYTINQESRYLIVRNVPALGCVEDLVKLFALYGTIEEYRLLDEEETEEHTDVYWIRFQEITAARIAKRKCDDYNFIGKLLDVAYAPQFESVQDMRNKLEERKRIVARKIAQNMAESTNTSKKSARGAEPEAPEPSLDPTELPFEAPPEHTPTAFEQMPAARYRMEGGALYNARAAPVAGQPPPPPPRGQPRVREDGEVQQPLGRQGGGGMVETYVPDSSVNATVLSIRNKLTKISNASPAQQQQNPQASQHKYPSQAPDQGSYYETPPAPAAAPKRKRI